MKRIKEEELKKIDKNLVALHPNKILKELRNLILKVGAEKFLRSAGYNKERDAFIACYYTYAIRKHTGQEWFLRQINDPPDFEIFSYSEKQIKDNPGLAIRVEIVSIPELIDKESDKLKFATNLLLNTKLKEGYVLEKNTTLLIFINAHCAREVYIGLRKWFNQNTNLFNKFGAIFVFYLTNPNNISEYVVIDLKTNEFLKMNLEEEFKKEILPTPYMDKFGIIIE